jgi:cytochrome c oxidase subunit 2
VDAILRYLTLTTGGAMAILTAVFLWVVLMHRGKRRQAFYTHGDRPRDRLLAALAGLVVLVGIDAVALVRSAEQLRTGFWRYPDADPRTVRVEVTARQWSWTFRESGSDGRFGTPDDVVTLNELRVPVDRPVYLQLTSKDVVHSLYLPNFRNKIDAVPGAVTRMWFHPRETGVYEIACAQHCGAWHYKMRGELAVLSADDYDRWSERAAIDPALTGADAGEAWPWGSGGWP